MAVVISLNRFMAPVDDTVTTQHKSQVTSHKQQPVPGHQRASRVNRHPQMRLTLGHPSSISHLLSQWSARASTKPSTQGPRPRNRSLSGANRNPGHSRPVGTPWVSARALPPPLLSSSPHANSFRAFLDLWRGYFAEPQSSTGPRKLFKVVTE